MMRKFTLLVSVMFIAMASGFSNGNEEATVPGAEERVKMVIALDKMPEGVKLEKALADVVKMEKYSHVDFEIRESEADFNTTLPITVAAGEQL